MSFDHHLTITGNRVSLETIYKQFDRGNHSRLEWDTMPAEMSAEDMQRLLRGMKMVYQGNDHLELYTNLNPDDATKFILSKFTDVQIKVKEIPKMAPYKQFNITGDSKDLEEIYKQYGKHELCGMERVTNAYGNLNTLIVHHQVHPIRIKALIQPKYPNVKFSE